MALMRYIGPHPEVRVVVAGNEIGVVENGGSIVVPDELAGLTAWSEDHWEDVSKDAAEKKKAREAAKDADKAAGAPLETENGKDEV